MSLRSDSSSDMQVNVLVPVTGSQELLAQLDVTEEARRTGVTEAMSVPGACSAR
jgi:hypothetical protein